MLETILIGLAVAITVVVVTLWVRAHMRKAAQRTVLDYIEKFPGRCMICGLHRYGIQEGHVKASEPVTPHDCIEK